MSVVVAKQQVVRERMSEVITCDGCGKKAWEDLPIDHAPDTYRPRETGWIEVRRVLKDVQQNRLIEDRTTMFDYCTACVPKVLDALPRAGR